MSKRSLLLTTTLLAGAGAAAAAAAPAAVTLWRLYHFNCGGWGAVKDVSDDDPHIQELGSWAVAEHVRRANDGLRFGKVRSVQKQLVSGMNYRLYLDASDAGGDMAAYSAVVYEQEWTNTRKLTSFERDGEMTRKDIGGKPGLE